MNSCARSRLESLDDAFLFAIGSTNIVLVFFQIVLRGLDAALLSMPLLVVGLLVPFYIGYLRGAIVVNNVLERIRGWIYFTAGTSVYAAGLAAIFLRGYGDLSLILYLLFYGIGFVLSRSWIRSLVRATDTHLSSRDLLVLGATAGATIALVSASLIGEEHIRFYTTSPPPTYRPEDLIVRVGTVAFALLAFVIVERTARRLALSTQEVAFPYEVSSIRGALGGVMLSSIVCFIRGVMSDKRALVSAGISFLALFALVTAALTFPKLSAIVVIVTGLLWVVPYSFALYKYVKVQMGIPTTEDILAFGTARQHAANSTRNQSMNP
jgi:hypothetical protein